MGWPGCIDGTCDGDPRDAVLAVRGFIVGGAIKALITPNPLCVGTYFAVWVNGVWQGPNHKAALNGDIEVLANVDPGTDVGSIWIEQVGIAETFDPSFVPSNYAEAIDALSANRLRIHWTVPYSVMPRRGDAQLSSITVTGALRNLNVEPIEDAPYRGRLFYTITSVGTTRIVRWYANGRLVAEGSRVGNGAITCAARNNSGLSIALTLIYTGAVALGAAWMDLTWAVSYQIHYVKDAVLGFPRAAQATVRDIGSVEMKYRSPILAAGAYDYNVLGVSDAGAVMPAPPAAGDSPKTIYDPPAAPTITGVTGTAAGGLVVHFTNGVAGCTYKGYYRVNGPINFGHLPSPAPIGPTAVNATSLTLAAVSPAVTDNTADYATVLAVFNAAAAALNTAYTTGETGFVTALDTNSANVVAGITAYQTALGKRLQEFIDAHAGAMAQLRAEAVANEGLGLSTADWQAALRASYTHYLAALGDTLVNDPNKYALPDGTLPGTTADGAEGAVELGVDSLYVAAQPFVKPAILRVIVRATKGGIEELTDNVFIVELAADGSVQDARPNNADIQSISDFSLTPSVTAGVQEVNGMTAAASMEILVDGVAVASAALPAAVLNYHEVAIPITVTAGYHKLAARAITAGGQRSAAYKEEEFYFGGTFVSAVGDLGAEAIRGLGQ